MATASTTTAVPASPSMANSLRRYCFHWRSLKSQLGVTTDLCCLCMHLSMGGSAFVMHLSVM